MKNKIYILAVSLLTAAAMMGSAMTGPMHAHCQEQEVSCEVEADNGCCCTDTEPQKPEACATCVESGATENEPAREEAFNITLKLDRNALIRSVSADIHENPVLPVLSFVSSRIEPPGQRASHLSFTILRT